MKHTISLITQGLGQMYNIKNVHIAQCNTLKSCKISGWQLLDRKAVEKQRAEFHDL